MRQKVLLVIIVLTSLLLRVYSLSNFPTGLYSDEAAYGFNAFSLILTGKDEHGVSFPLSFESFGDFKPPMSAWLNVPTIILFGLNEFAVRLPSAILGTLTVLVVFLIVKEIIRDKLNRYKFLQNTYTPYIASILLLISPWHIIFSRSNMLVGIEAFFVSLGFLLFLKALKNPYLLVFSALAFVGAIYTYYGSRVTVSTLLILLFLIFRKELFSIRKYFLIALFTGIVALSPLIVAIVKDPETLTGRAKTISIFYDEDIKLRLWEAHTLDGSNFSTTLSRFFNNKTYYYYHDFLRRYFQHFSVSFLFSKGDYQMPFDLPRMGVSYLIDLPFFLVGLFLIFKIKTKKLISIFAYLLVSPVAASLTFITPAANRSFNMVVPWAIICALGIIYLSNFVNKKYRPLLFVSIFVTYLISFSFFLYIYFYLMPKETPNMWHHGRREMVNKLIQNENNYQNVILSREAGPVYIWLLFYQKYDPQTYWESSKITESDNLGWRHIESFGKYSFVENLKWEKVDKVFDTLYVGFEDEIPNTWNGVVSGENAKIEIIDSVLYPNANTAFKFVRVIRD